MGYLDQVTSGMLERDRAEARERRKALLKRAMRGSGLDTYEKVGTNGLSPTASTQEGAPSLETEAETDETVIG